MGTVTVMATVMMVQLYLLSRFLKEHIIVTLILIEITSIDKGLSGESLLLNMSGFRHHIAIIIAVGTISIQHLLNENILHANSLRLSRLFLQIRVHLFLIDFIEIRLIVVDGWILILDLIDRRMNRDIKRRR